VYRRIVHAAAAAVLMLLGLPTTGAAKAGDALAARDGAAGGLPTNPAERNRLLPHLPHRPRRCPLR